VKKEMCVGKEGREWEVWREREDLRGLVVCSIDPPGTTFFLSD
jgi:hypothetical protein